MSKQEVSLCEGLANSLTHAIEKCPHDKLFILTDEHTHRLCRPHLDGIPALEEAEEIIPLLSKLMTTAVPLPVKLDVEGSIGKTWYDAKD